ncbi:hypothetical protein HAX54_048228 [Datura stramonium]|uniref:Pectinesterase catalytic domain-containing protein n=1 Tax=Datura stramonium TaxID=4076 RepID=A0ABS8SU57_DATST|nr:hypothetical protein [Datura stramonium]
MPDAIDKPEYKSSIENGLKNATQLTNNAISIVAKMSEVLKSFNIQIPEGLSNNTNSSLTAALRGGPPLPPVGSGPLPHAVVAKDGSGQFKTVTDAVKAYPPNHQGRYIIYVKAGVYNEQVLIDKKQPNVFMYGDGIGKSIITCDKSVGVSKVTTSTSATVAVNSADFIAKGITFRNTAGAAAEQAVALRISGDRAAVFDCSMEAFQDTLYYQTYRQFYRNCIILLVP